MIWIDLIWKIGHAVKSVSDLRNAEAGGEVCGYGTTSGEQ